VGDAGVYISGCGGGGAGVRVVIVWRTASERFYGVEGEPMKLLDGGFLTSLLLFHVPGFSLQVAVFRLGWGRSWEIVRFWPSGKEGMWKLKFGRRRRSSRLSYALRIRDCWTIGGQRECMV
jgi:hypothetical protein